MTSPHTHRAVRLPLLLLGLVLAAAPAGADDAPATEEVKPGRLVLTLALDGVLEPRQSREVAYEGEVYGGPLDVVEATGSRTVAEGEVLVRFEDEDAQRQLVTAERELKLAGLKLSRLEAELRARSISRELKLEQLEERLQRAEDALSRFLSEEKPTRIEQSEFGLQGMDDRLADDREELRQLEKMYKADDLTEETEEIVLMRARRGLERLEKSIGFARLRHRLLLEVSLPNEETDLRMQVRERRAELDAGRATARQDMEIDQLGFAKAADELDRQREQMQALQKDVDALRLRAPVAGLAVPGRFQDGKWVDVDLIERLAEGGGRLKPGQIAFTIIHPGNVRVAASVAEGDALKLRTGQRVRVRPGVLPETELEGTVAEVRVVPVGGKVAVWVDLKDTDARLVPGQSAKVEISWREADDVLTVPQSAVRTEGNVSQVWVWRDRKAEARAVQLGARAEGRVEVLSGLAAGEHVLVKAPEAGK